MASSTIFFIRFSSISLLLKLSIFDLAISDAILDKPVKQSIR